LKTLQPVETPKDSRPELVQASAANALAEKASANAKSTGEKLNMFSPVVITIPAAEAPGRAVNKSIPFLPNPLLKSDTKDNGVGKHTSPPVDQEPNSVTEPAITSGATTKSPDISVPCLLSSTEDSLSIQSDGGEKAVVIGSEKDIDLGVLKAVSSSPELVSVRREPVVGIDSRALFVIKAAPKSQGVYQITFALPCGEKVIVVNVR
jgi:hypothetical protein